MRYKRSIIPFALSCLSMALLASCGQGETATKADPNNIYEDEHWSGVAFPNYRELTTYTHFGPFDVSEQCVAAIYDSGIIDSDRSAFECCIIDEQYENYPGKFERRKVCDHNFQWSVHIESDFHGAYEQCADPADLCNERGQLVRELVRNSQRNAEIYASQIDSAMQDLFSAESTTETKEDARTRLLRAYNKATDNVSPINMKIYLDAPMKAHDEIEREIVLGRDASATESDKRVFEDALTGVNRNLIEDTLTEIIEKASSLIEGNNASMSALELDTKVDAVLKYDPKKQFSNLNSIFDGMSAAEISDKRQKISSIGLIRIEKTPEPETYYNCTSGVGNAYRLRYIMHAVDIAHNQVTGSIELFGTAPPEKIESYKCEGVGPPPDWSHYFEIADIN